MTKPHAACRIRRARRSDLGGIVSLCHAHAEYERATFDATGQEARLERSLFGRSPRAWCLVVEAQGALVGYATWSREFSTWRAAEFLHVDCLFLEPAHRGSGIGRRMMGMIARRLCPLGATHLEWQTPVWNGDAARFYERLGARGLPKIRFAWHPDLRC